MGNAVNPGKEMKFEELEEQVKYLVGEEFLSKTIDQANEAASKFLFEKLYEQLDAIIVLSSLDTPEDSTKVANYASVSGKSISTPETPPPELSFPDKEDDIEVPEGPVFSDEKQVDRILAEELSQKSEEVWN